MKRKLLVVIEALIVLAGAFLINVHLLGKQGSLPFGAKGDVAVAAVTTAAGEASDVKVQQEAPSLVRMPAPFTADEVDRLARELFGERERLKTEGERLSRERVELERIAKDLRSRRETLATRMKDAQERRSDAAPAAKAAPSKTSSADAKAMAGIFDKMRPDAAAQRLSVMEPKLAARVLGKMRPKQAAKALGVMDPSRAASLAARIPSKKRQR